MRPVLAALVAVAGLAAAAAPSQARRVLVVAVPTDVPALSPLTGTDRLGKQLAAYAVYTPLVWRDTSLRLLPRLARGWSVRGDTLLTFRLRPEARWHDGRPVTAHDMVWTYGRAQDPRSGFPDRASLEMYGAARAVDAHTFQVRMRPHVDFLEVWTELAPMPRHLLDTVPAERLATHPLVTQRPVGSGPWRVVGREPGQGWTLQAVPGYPVSLGGTARLGAGSRLAIRVIPEPVTRAVALVTGEAHLALAVGREQVATLRRAAGVELRSAQNLAVIAIAWNHRRPPLGDARLRLAFGLALDRGAMVQVAGGGVGRPALTSVPPSVGGPVAPGRADPAAAGRLLDGLGWRDRDGDGVRESAAGRPLEFGILVYPGSTASSASAELARAQLQRVGVRLRPESLEWGTLQARIQNPRRDFDAALVSISPGWIFDPRPTYACERRDGPMQLTGWCDPAADRLLDSLAIIGDPRRRDAFRARYVRRLAEQQPVTALYQPGTTLGVRREVLGVGPDPRGELARLPQFRWASAPARR